MKNIIILILSIATSAISAQSLPELINQYEKECFKIVSDTIEQTGKITYDLVPVRDSKGAILHYALGTPDTVWNAPNCPEYKEYNRGITFITSGTFWAKNSINTLVGSNYGPISGSEKTQKTEVDITRQYICEVKQREVEPFSEDFWNWLRKQTK